jgi:pimeloyl-ACP methyl ester carboxylesterase
MQRPMMSPIFLEDEAPAAVRPFLLHRLTWPLRCLATLLLIDVCFWRRSHRLKIEDGALASRILRGLAYRLLFVPVMLAFVVVALVYIGTHPPRVYPTMDPLSHGIYYDPIAFTSADGTRLEGWFVPDIDAKAVLAKKEEVLRTKRPAVILVHDYGANRVQMLPLVQPLHEAGYIVLVISLRGTGGMVSTGSTFGLREADDVLAAAETLRRRPGVDPDRIAVLGVGTGANAAILAAERDPKIAAIILDHPVVHINQVIDKYLGPPQPWLRWLGPACKWAFELGYHIDAEDLDLKRRQDTLASRPLLMFDPTAIPAHSYQQIGIAHLQDFLHRHLPIAPNTATAKTE